VLADAAAGHAPNHGLVTADLVLEKALLRAADALAGA
jgi:hypothetical protein